MAEDRNDGRSGHREPRLRDLARRIIREVEDGIEDRARPDEPPRAEERSKSEERPREDRHRMGEMLGAVLETGDKAKTEVVRMVAREVRNYLEELRVGDDLHDLLTNYSVEVHASLHLKPLHEDDDSPPSASAGLKKKKKSKAAKAEPEHEEEED